MIHSCGRPFQFNLQTVLATQMKCEDVQVGFSLRSNMSDAEIFHGGHGSKFHNLLRLYEITRKYFL